MPPEPLSSAAPQKRRWQVTSAIGITQIFSFGSTYYLLGVLSGPISAETGWPLTFMSGAQSAGMLAAGLVSPWIGRRINMFGGRTVMAAGFASLAIGLALIGLSPNQPLFVIGWLVTGLGMGATLYDAAFASLGKLYGSSARPALTAVTLWGGFASTVCWPLSAALLEPVGWRGACLTYAAIHLAICVPLVIWSLPTAVAAESRGHRSEDDELPAQDARLLAILMASFVIAALTMSVIYIHLIELLQSRGLALAAAVSLGTLIGPSQVAARAIDLALGGRHHPVWTFLVSLALSAFGLFLFALELPTAAVPIILFSAGNGIYSIARGSLPLALFGPRHYATIVGRLARPSYIAYALAPSVGAVLITTLGAGNTINLLTAIAAANLGLGLFLVVLVRRRV